MSHFQDIRHGPITDVRMGRASGHYRMDNRRYGGEVCCSCRAKAAAGTKMPQEKGALHSGDCLWRMSGMNKNVPANLAAAVAALCAGTSVVVTRLAVGEIGPIGLAFYRYVVAECVLFRSCPSSGPRFVSLSLISSRSRYWASYFLDFFLGPSARLCSTHRRHEARLT